MLVVDDDEAKRYILTTWLRRAGHTVIQAATRNVTPSGSRIQPLGARRTTFPTESCCHCA